MSRERLSAVFILAAIAILYLSGLSAAGIFDPEEGRHVSIATAMLRSRDFVVPQLQGFPYLEKPPLAYWLIASAYRLLGRGELASRLPVAMMGIAGIGATYVVAKAALGTRAGWLSAGVLALSTQWFAQSRYMTTDMILAGCVTIALASFWWGAATRRFAGFAVFYAAMALAVLAKGLVGLVLPCGVVAAFVVATGRWRILKDMRPLWGAAVFVAIAAPWFVLIGRRLPEFFHYFVMDQHVARFLGAAHEHPEPFWFFLPVLAFGFFPWIAYLPAATTGLGEGGDFPKFLWSWFATIFVFFSAAQEKMMGYLLPAYPALAMLVGGFLARAWEPARDAAATRRLCQAALVAGFLLLVLSPLFVIGLERFMAQNGRLSMAEIGVWPWALAIIYASTGVGTIALAWIGRARSLLIVTAAGQVLAFAVFVGAAAAADPPLGFRSIGAQLATQTGPDDTIVLYRITQPSVEYYTGRPPVLFGWTGEFAWGMQVRPDSALATQDVAELRALFPSSQGDVWLVTNAGDDAAKRELALPMELVASNRRRAVYRIRREEIR